MKCLGKLTNIYKSLTIFVKCSILDIWKSSEYSFKKMEMNVTAKQYPEDVSSNYGMKLQTSKVFIITAILCVKEIKKECFQKNTKCLLYQRIAVFGIVKLFRDNVTFKNFY